MSRFEPIALELLVGRPDELQSAAPGPNGTFSMPPAPRGDARQARACRRHQRLAGRPVAALGRRHGGDPARVPRRNDEIDIVVQPSGKTPRLATVATRQHDRTATGVVRLNETAPSTTASAGSNNGIRVIDSNSVVRHGGTLSAFDAARSIAVAADGTIYLHALQRGVGDAAAGGPRQDTDFAVVKLSADGIPDATFANNAGKFLLDFEESNATARGSTCWPTARSWRAATPTRRRSGRPSPCSTASAGVLVDEFATEGIFDEAVLAMQTEVYGVAVHGDHFVTGGYGREGGETNDWVSLRFDAATGERDKTFGGAEGGAVIIDPSGEHLGEQLPRATLARRQDAAARFDRSGQHARAGRCVRHPRRGRSLDSAYGDAVFTYPFRENGADQFWGAAVSGEATSGFGYSGAGMTQSEELNNNAYAVFLPLE